MTNKETTWVIDYTLSNGTQHQDICPGYFTEAQVRDSMISLSGEHLRYDNTCIVRYKIKKT